LLGNDLETNNETSAARQQILNKQIYAAVTENAFAKKKHVPMERIEVHNNVFYAVRAKELSMGRV
jgi:hypothetical protein